MTPTTNEPIEIQYDKVLQNCRNIFTSKLKDYSISWLHFRLLSGVDHMLIKALRIKTLEENGGKSLVNESRESEYLGIINYAIICVLLFAHKKNLPLANNQTITDEETTQIMSLYTNVVEECRNLLLQKNHDYGNAWRAMETTTFTDIIIARITRIKSIVKNNYVVNSENIDAQLLDIINYCVFALVQL